MNCQEVILKNAETGKETIFESMQEAARFLECGS